MDAQTLTMAGLIGSMAIPIFLITLLFLEARNKPCQN